MLGICRILGICFTIFFKHRMANKEHLEILKSGIDRWNAWRTENADVRPDLSGADLSRANLRQADLHAVGLNRTNLCWADLSGASLSEANLHGLIYNHHIRWPANFDPAVRGAINLDELE